MNKNNFDKLFNRLLLDDRIGKPDEAIEHRLIYAFFLKSGFSKLRQNSFAGFWEWLFSLQGIGLKTGLAGVLLFISLMGNQISPDPEKTSISDSLTTKRVLLADSTRFIQNMDSIYTVNLN